MKLVRNSNLIKGLAIFLCLMLFQSGFEIQAIDGKYEKELAVLKEKYKSEKYDEIIIELEKLLNEIGEENTRIRGQFFLLLGAAQEKTGEREKAVENYLLGDLLLDKPEIEGIDLSSLEIYKNTLFGKVINGKRVFEKVGKRKRKKKFPFLAVLGVAALVTTVFLLMKKKSDREQPNFKESYAIEVFNEIEWIDIPAGEFTMGDTHGLGSADESPEHIVYLDSYKISKYEITYEQFDKFADVNAEIRTYHEGSGNAHPVRNINQDNVEQFCLWIWKYTGKTISLPTEAQWEKAAKGVDNRIYPWGNSSPDCSILNYNNCVGRTSQVGTNPNDISYYGVMDMGGNLSEMINDFYGEDYYSISPYSNPEGPEGGDSQERLVRGGNWNSSDPRVSNRNTRSVFTRNDNMGFRIVWID
ncbi:MAG: SUMF1/EgtB/PvdO family nonheme iron enzyme [Candidatus Aminicenantes bacterium]|nr:SUMF1/EgtB/PvdO family nonheme iron enzyme [Candidatus Aminicenantes bacterium]